MSSYRVLDDDGLVDLLIYHIEYESRESPHVHALRKEILARLGEARDPYPWMWRCPRHNTIMTEPTRRWGQRPTPNCPYCDATLYPSDKLGAKLKIPKDSYGRTDNT